MGRGGIGISTSAELAGAQIQLLLSRLQWTMFRGGLGILATARYAGTQTQLLLHR